MQKTLQVQLLTNTMNMYLHPLSLNLSGGQTSSGKPAVVWRNAMSRFIQLSKLMLSVRVISDGKYLCIENILHNMENHHCLWSIGLKGV